MYDYIPSITEKLKHRYGPMYKAGLAFAVRTKEVVQDFMRWYVVCITLIQAILCSLEEKCIAPDGSNYACEFNDGSYDQRVTCHRFDQSLMSLLLTNRNDYKVPLWATNVENCFTITPERISRRTPKICKSIS
ncbi:unnamed protein product [Soboliphyme baturini]|uniref:Innexin n=1 Tax=Soboliphyme baturini TaxID=241478 RepID=A0A183J0H4_9BILA|nr:unnamed protein product [Soboliphyme baturini]